MSIGKFESNRKEINVNVSGDSEIFHFLDWKVLLNSNPESKTSCCHIERRPIKFYPSREERKINLNTVQYF